MAVEEPLSCGVQASSLKFDTPPKEVRYGVNEVGIHTSVRSDVSIVTDSRKECKVTLIAVLWEIFVLKYIRIYNFRV